MSPLRPQPKGLGAIAAIAIMLVGRTDNSASAAEGRGRSALLTGLWQSIQANDGSLATYSITDVDHDGMFTIQTHEFFLSSRGGDFGIIAGTATIDDAGALVEVGTVTCPNGDVFDVNRTFRYRPQFDILLLKGAAAPANQARSAPNQ